MKAQGGLAHPRDELPETEIVETGLKFGDDSLKGRTSKVYQRGTWSVR